MEFWKLVVSDSGGNLTLGRNDFQKRLNHNEGDQEADSYGRGQAVGD